GTLLVGQAIQTDFAGFEGTEEDRYADVVRVFPKPPKIFSSYRIPKSAKVSLIEGGRAFQAGAYIAACVMFGRALEAVCRDILQEKDGAAEKGERRPIMLAAGLRQLKDRKIIDDRYMIGASSCMHLEIWLRIQMTTSPYRERM